MYQEDSIYGLFFKYVKWFLPATTKSNKGPVKEIYVCCRNISQKKGNLVT